MLSLTVLDLLCPAVIREFASLNEEDHAVNLQLAFDISEQEFGIQPFTSVRKLSAGEELEKTKMISYLSKFYELFRGTPLPASGTLLRFSSCSHDNYFPFFLKKIVEIFCFVLFSVEKHT